jgi:phage terminase large subunit-like protein
LAYSNWEDVLRYAESIRDGQKIACTELKQAVDRFFRDLDNPAYDLDHTAPEFCIRIIERTFCHQQGELMDGTPLRGTPFLLMDFHKFIIYNLLGFKHHGTDICRFHEALIFIPRKNVKTSFAAALAWALSLWYRKSGSKCYIASAALMQSLESFNFIDYNIRRMGEWDKEGGHCHIINNNNEHSIEGKLSDGSFFIRALAASPDRQDSLNANICICDEIHAFKQPKQYNLFKECQKAYTNKLLIGISTAGDNEQAFLGQRLKYCRQVLNGTVEDEQYFIFMCCAKPDENDDKWFLRPEVHEMANPGYGQSIRPQEIANDARQALNDPQQRKDFFAKSLNVYTAAMKAYFDIEDFRSSDMQYTWTLEELAKLPVDWYGGADLSKVKDLTAACLYGNYGGVDIIITHAFFPVTQAAAKQDQDGIPLYEWLDEGWLTMCNGPTIIIQDVVDWFVSMRERGFKIKQVGHDRKFAGEEYIPLMKRAHFSIVDQPQLYYLKSQGFRHIEKAAADGKLYYCHSTAYEYCIQNVKAQTGTDDAITFEKISPQHRIDLFDASVFACIRMIKNQEKRKKARAWFGE